VPPGRHGTAFPLIAPYRVFSTADGELMVAAGNDGLFGRLCDTLELPALAADPRFATNPLRVEHRDALESAIEARMRTRTTAEWLDRLERAGVPAAPVQDVAQLAAHEQTRALGILQELAGRTTVATPLSADGERPLHESPPPLLGEHTVEVLTELGLSRGEIDQLEAAGVVAVGKPPAR
jgi:formyl-CoA transferase/CoA:oxalate CoA-transferase